MSEAKTSNPRLTPRGHIHAEAFCLMWYVCKDCGAKDRIWNSRDGVTPFGMNCASCGGQHCYHAYFGSDEYAPNHKLRDGQRFWRDGTPDEAVAIMKRRIESMRAEYPLTPEQEARLIEECRTGTQDSGFMPGWPMLDVHREKLL